MKKKHLFVFIEVLSAISWMSIPIVFRRLVSDQDVLYVFGFAPNFFAAINLMFSFYRLANKVENDPLSNKFLIIASFRTMLFLYLGELIQKYLLKGVYDNADLLASLIGVLLSLGIFIFTQKKWYLNR